jgi:hypothetical protein
MLLKSYRTSSRQSLDEEKLLNKKLLVTRLNKGGGSFVLYPLLFPLRSLDDKVEIFLTAALKSPTCRSFLFYYY